jgi:hypothetical protein
VAFNSPAFLAWEMKPPGGGPWPVWKAGGGREAYEPDDVDFFFIVDGDMTHYYLVPSQEVAGFGSVSLATLEHRKVDR